MSSLVATMSYSADSSLVQSMPIPKLQDIRGQHSSDSNRMLTLRSDTTLVLQTTSTAFATSSPLSSLAVSMLRLLLNYVKRWPQEKLIAVLKRFSGDEVFEILEKHYSHLLTELAAFMLWLSSAYGLYGEPELGVALDPDSGSPLFIVITIPGCSADEWDEIVRKVKHIMSVCGLHELRRSVAIVCAKGVVESEA